MFLNYLKEENKEYFLKVCVHAALANGVFADREKEMLDTYCREMNVDVHLPDTNESFTELLNLILENTSSAERNIFVLETLALVKVDGVYDEQEKSFMTQLINGLEVCESEFLKFYELLDKYIEIGSELFTAING